MDIKKYLPKLIRASLDNDPSTIRSLSMRIIRRLKETDPDIADEIAEALNYYGVGHSTRRSIGISDAPVNTESRSTLAIVEEPPECERPIFSEKLNQFIDEFIHERRASKKLMAAGLTPPSSLLVFGQPGVGKTFLAKYLASVFNLKFVTLDLSSSISSYLGKTGENLKSVLSYAREEPSLLLLDEFDAIAKRRDDMTDLGELKRIVNVLLKELEHWPPHSILMAATNHPDLLDKAIWRRFDHSIEIELPGYDERLALLHQNHEDDFENDDAFLEVTADLTNGFSAADICKLSQKAKRKVITTDINIHQSLLTELVHLSKKDDVEFNKRFCKIARKKTKLPIRTLAEYLGKSPSAVQYYLKD